MACTVRVGFFESFKSPDSVRFAGDEAGGDNQELPTPCRSGQNHVRGCWVLVLLPGKELSRGDAMTEAEWDAGGDPTPMLDFLRRSGKASDRKLRLFACGCCRRIWPLLTDERGRRAVEVAELLADLLAGDQVRSDARREAQQASGSRGVERWPRIPKGERRAASAAYWAVAREVDEAVGQTPRLAIDAVVWQAGGPERCDWSSLQARERMCQAALLRDLFGPLPFREVRIDSSWVAWGDGTVRKLAEATYQERRFEDLPVLADALLDAGCGDEEILAHCREPGPHARGCWLVDALLARS
jgi:hypothetical protein